ncbi:hypothetical protein C2G38_2180872 [Gigaspora rosea]|uniref:Uncharacterized protein n=1 Tax=Gigaspora rosea TaxID=44941 RepID=A0A397VFR9_9GLOM|nr:hypothetical protein C2G38_2180872 [Gigaspora rosea]CAG8495525.1 23378_t:CDS:1 [Gigaspora rosea]
MDSHDVSIMVETITHPLQESQSLQESNSIQESHSFQESHSSQVSNSLQESYSSQNSCSSQESLQLQGSQETPPLQESQETPPQLQELHVSLTFTHLVQEPLPTLINPLRESQSILTHPLQVPLTNDEYPSTTPSLTAQMSILSNDTLSPQREYLPSYYSAIQDMPPIYNPNPNAIDQSMTTTVTIDPDQNETFQLEPHHRIDPFQIFEPIQPQEDTVLIKNFYFYGFIFLPFWFIGACYLFSKYPIYRIWAKRCVCNLAIVLAVFCYIIISLTRTDGKWV